LQVSYSKAVRVLAAALNMHPGTVEMVLRPALSDTQRARLDARHARTREKGA
jgi:hypothetical protein